MAGAMTRPLVRLREGIVYWPGPGEFVITEQHSIDDVLRHLIGECGGDREELLAILATVPDASTTPAPEQG